MIVMEVAQMVHHVVTHPRKMIQSRLSWIQYGLGVNMALSLSIPFLVSFLFRRLNANIRSKLEFNFQHGKVINPVKSHWVVFLSAKCVFRIQLFRYFITSNSTLLPVWLMDDVNSFPVLMIRYFLLDIYLMNNSTNLVVVFIN